MPSFRLMLPCLLASVGCGGDMLLSTKTEGGGVDTASDACEPLPWYQDADSDGYGAGEAVMACEPPSDRYTHIDGDCDDGDAAVSPTATEVCNELDDNCNGAVDESGGAETWYADSDGDGHGDPDAPTSACTQPAGTVDSSDDCDDTNAAVSPAGIELCNGIDDDCNGEIDDNPTDTSTWYADSDGDGYGDPSVSVEACPPGDGWVANSDDCNDLDGTNWDDCGSSSGGGCTDTVHQWSDSSPSQPELHIVSVYEADGGHGGPPGNITVDIDRPGNVVLVLSSYEPVDWTVREQAGTTIDEVILNGYHTQRLVSGAASATVLDRSYESSGTYWTACGYAWPSSSGGCDTPGLVSAAELHSGLDLAGFVGCYHGTSFSVN